MVASFACLCFFFKQKTAYELRISDWSSDVCSSDLSGRRTRRHDGGEQAEGYGYAGAAGRGAVVYSGTGRHLRLYCFGCRECGCGLAVQGPCRAGKDRRGGRSEEHTSELQSLMRISYAVFCLKKKTNNNQSTS